jgi:hypothetical protein
MTGFNIALNGSTRKRKRNNLGSNNFSKSYPITYKTMHLCWCRPGEFSDIEYIRGKLIDPPPYKDREFKLCVDSDDKLIYMEDSTRMSYIPAIQELLKNKKFRGLNPPYVLHSFEYDKFSIITCKVIDGIDYYDPRNIFITGVISGNFAHYYSHSTNETRVFKRSAMINSVIARHNHSGSGTNMITKYLKLLQCMQVSVCFLKAVPEAFYFYFKYGFALFSSYRDEKQGDIVDELFAIDLIDYESKANYSTMQRAPSTNVDNSQPNNIDRFFLNNTEAKLASMSYIPYTSFFYKCLNEIELLKPGEKWKLLSDIVTFESKKNRNSTVFKFCSN